MDFEKHYQSTEAKVEHDNIRARKLAADSSRISELATYNDSMQSLARDIPDLLTMYTANPPAKCEWIEVGGRRTVAWKLTKCKDNRHVYNAWLLSDGRIGIIHTQGTWRESYEPAVNEHGGEYQKMVSCYWSMSFSSDLFDILTPDTVDDFEGNQRLYLEAVCEAAKDVRYRVEEPKRVKELAKQAAAEERRDAQERAELRKFRERERIARIMNTPLTFTEQALYRAVNIPLGVLVLSGGITLLLAILVTLAQGAFIGLGPIDYLAQLTSQERQIGLSWALLTFSVIGIPTLGVMLLNLDRVYRKDVPKYLWSRKWSQELRRGREVT